MQPLQGDLFTDFPDLRLAIPHDGGAASFHWGRFRGLADMLGRPPLAEAVMGNAPFDTCVYHQPGIDLLFTVIGASRILFGSEMIGAVRGIGPTTTSTSAAISTPSACPRGAVAAVYGLNVRRIYPRLSTPIKDQP